MMIQSRQLEELQARIREAENRLKSRQSVQLGANDVPEKIEEESAQTGELSYFRSYDVRSSLANTHLPSYSAGQPRVPAPRAGAAAGGAKGE